MNSKPAAAPKKRMPFENIDTSFGNGDVEGPPHTTWYKAYLVEFMLC